MDSSRPAVRAIARRRLAIATIALLGACWSAQSIARTPTGLDCGHDHIDRNNLDSPFSALRAEPVDHVPIATEPPGREALDLDSETADATTPLLDLAPNVAKSYSEIFDDMASSTETDTAVTAPTAAPLSPIAEADDDADKVDGQPDATLTYPVDDDIDLPLLQRRMFRTDI